MKMKFKTKIKFMNKIINFDQKKKSNHYCVFYGIIFIKKTKFILDTNFKN